MPAKVSSEVGLTLRVRGGCKGIRRNSPAPERQSTHLAAYSSAICWMALVWESGMPVAVALVAILVAAIHLVNLVVG